MAGISDKKKKQKTKDGPELRPENLPDNLRTQHTHMTCGEHMNYHTNTRTSATTYMALGVDNSWSQREFEAQFRVEGIRWSTPLDDNGCRTDRSSIEFDLIGIDPAIANAFRRILISDLPTMAVEHVFIINNTSVMNDDVLAHRLGLVPLNLDPDLFQDKAEGEAASEMNTVVFKLVMACEPNADKPISVMSKELRWLPKGSQLPQETECEFVSSQEELLPHPAAPVHNDILLLKLGAGQEIELEAHAVRGVGRDHAKWSPVSTAWYRLHPEIVFTKPVTGTAAEELAAACPEIFSVVDGQTVAAAARGNELHLEKVRRLAADERWAGRLELRKRKDHFVFTVDSTGALPPQTLFTRAIDVLAEKADRLLQRL
ncbi:hypothetical protein WJX81_000618 [Elliptochloris bilobata]|uniref:Plastid-encoded RNA polymerase subunit alpha n=1 Tax=Elliptochloris bilobata TaxID=381761 RepID=A0AAW1RQR8_9CHLO